nr:hypothetical protein [Tanacetum cinerariifolium]
AAFLSERDAEIVHLKSLLSLNEVEAVEAIRLRGQLTTVEAADVAKDSELKDFKEKNFTLEGDRDVMSKKITTLESANAAKEAELAGLHWSLRLSFSVCAWRPCRMIRQRMDIGCAVNKGIQDGLRAGVVHGKAGRDLSVIEAYDPSTEAKYVEAVNALGAVDFS